LYFCRLLSCPEKWKQYPEILVFIHRANSITFAAVFQHTNSAVSTYLQELARRRTFAIIAHPDAGKTTLTEKLLLFGGAIQTAGAVKSNKIKKSTVSDFMEIERQRGISVSTSVMGFEYRDLQINILDTPGHEDFAEDTYRTLTAVDSTIVVIDVANGVEKQTEKLTKVCRMRSTPIIFFVNKMDREGKDAFDLLDEIEQKLDVKVRPLSWPIGMGGRFKGVYNLYEKKLVLFNPHGKQEDESIVVFEDLNDSELEKQIGESAAKTLREEVEVVETVYHDFHKQDYLDGKVCPVFFGSAVNNFGVKELLDCFVEIAPTPLARHAEERDVLPEEEKMTGFVFKIFANMDPRHRDRIAFMRICSGKFERNKNYRHIRLGREFKFPNPTMFMASKKTLLEEAYPGDVVGLYDSGNFKIGDTMTEGEILHFKGIPAFSPEQFRYVENADPLKQKQFAKGLDQLMDEGVAQMFVRQSDGRRIIGTVGQLQFEVIQHRLESEYGAKCRYESISLFKACWVSAEDPKALAEFLDRRKRDIAKDKDGNWVFMAETAWTLQTVQEAFPKINFRFTTES
jgi:peptide chain release factor 3